MIDDLRRTALFEEILADLAAEGYAKCSPEAAADRVGVSPGELRELGDRDACLFAAFGAVTSELMQRIQVQCEGAAGWTERVRKGLGELLEEAAARPTCARVITRDFPGIGPEAYARYSDFLGDFAPALREGRDYSEIGDELPEEVEILAVGSAEALIFAEIEAGQAATLPDMLPEILFSVLVPFIGPERAAEEMRLAAAT